LKADEWIGSVSSLLGGKGGGKEMSAQASGPHYECLKEAQQLAKEFAKLKVSK
jgi:alanyl-tRNA synthetase